MFLPNGAPPFSGLTPVFAAEHLSFEKSIPGGECVLLSPTVYRSSPPSER